jgi:hypothetical protein
MSGPISNAYAADEVRSLISVAVKALRLKLKQVAPMVKRPKGDEEKTDDDKIKRLSAFLTGREHPNSVPRHYLMLALDLRPKLREKGMVLRAEALEAACSRYCAQINPLDVRNYMALPKLHADRYRFRMPTVRGELAPFQKFSDKEPDIAGRHKGLEREKRLAFYQAWFERRPEAFLILDRLEDGDWRAIAVSIVLPLTEDGRNRFCRGEIATVNPDNISSGLIPYIVQSGAKSVHLLYDTLIVKQKEDDRGDVVIAKVTGVPVREDVQGWQTALVFCHISMLIDAIRAPVEVLVEPDFWQIDLECNIFGFAHAAENLWSVSYPTTGSAPTLFWDAFWRNIEQAQQWKI